ncbi:IPT/TIG domain-containing protein [Mucilaginibacter oryzae]|uniref:IPT/TIG domain-containing protein n=1 Tax=Mucilaginibacter oryzae TaxID=468058 RepID=UPI0014763172|nr:IPT/TIG domain-containing protein [Mucilaginibacter oryzae]
MVISSINVNEGPFNTLVEITGAGFSTTLADNKVFFNDKEGFVKTATETTLTANVPVGAGSGVIKVTVSGKTATGPLFTYLLTPVTTTIAGSGTAGANDADGTLASFNEPIGIVIDNDGNLYVADAKNNKIRKISPTGTVSTFAGSGTAGLVNGVGTAACFNHPDALTLDNAGNIYVADELNHVIRKITPTASVSTFAGSGTYGLTNGSSALAAFKNPTGITLDNSGNFYVADPQNNVIRKIDNTGMVNTFAGNSISALTDGTGTTASFNLPVSVAADKNGNVFVADLLNQRIRKITSAGVVTTVTTTGVRITSFDGINAITADATGNLYVSANSSVIKVNTDNVTTLMAGGLADAEGHVVDKSGNIFIADTRNNKILKISFQ